MTDAPPQNAYSKNYPLAKCIHNHAMPALRRLSDMGCTIQTIKITSPGATTIMVENDKHARDNLPSAEFIKQGDRKFMQAWLCCCRVIWELKSSNSLQVQNETTQ